MSVDIENGEAWERAAQEAIADLGIESEERLADLGQAMAVEMRASAPVGSRRHGFHGRQTIYARRGRDRQGFFVDVGATAKGFWLAFQEWGTSKMPPRPWARPAIERAIARAWVHR